MYLLNQPLLLVVDQLFNIYLVFTFNSLQIIENHWAITVFQQYYFVVQFFHSPKLSSEGVKGMNEKTEEKTISTPSAATGTPNQAEHTTKAGSSMRHEQAVLDDKGSSKESVSSHDPNNKTTASEQLQNSGEKIESEGTKFAMPALPSSKNSKPKQKKTPPPDSSLSRVLEGLKSGSINEKDAWKERRFKKHHPVEEQSEALQVL